MLSVDLSVHVPGVDSVDGVGIESVYQWEEELIREHLKSLLDDDDDENEETVVSAT